MKIGLVPMAGKPVHAGHWGLIQIAANENDSVKVFASTGDRDFIRGVDMMQVWQDYLIPALPGNVEVVFVPVPVKSVYDELQAGESSRSKDTYVIYSDEEDILKYKDESLKKNAPNLRKKKQIELRGVSRTETVNVSGTKMREYLAAGDFKAFAKFLPAAVRQHAKEIVNILTSKPANKKNVKEAILRRYIAELLLGS